MCFPCTKIFLQRKKRIMVISLWHSASQPAQVCFGLLSVGQVEVQGVSRSIPISKSPSRQCSCFFPECSVHCTHCMIQCTSLHLAGSTAIYMYMYGCHYCTAYFHTVLAVIAVVVQLKIVWSLYGCHCHGDGVCLLFFFFAGWHHHYNDRFSSYIPESW